MEDEIKLRGVRTHNLKNLCLSIPHGQITVVTGVSGSGKSSLVFDTLYAEGQRRYVESLSAYVRQFLDRMERPDVEKIEGMLPAIAIEAKNVITNARSTVGTQTEINDYLRLLFARVGKAHCDSCGRPITVDEPETVASSLIKEKSGMRAVILFDIELGEGAKKYADEVKEDLVKSGFMKAVIGGKIVRLDEFDASELGNLDKVSIVVDRMGIEEGQKSRLVDSLESAYSHGKDRLEILIFDKEAKETPRESLRFSRFFHCPSCDKEFRKPNPNMFSFNSPLGACPECQGFGRTITIDKDLVVPDKKKTIREGAIEPWTKESAQWEREQLEKFCRKQRIPLDKPWKSLTYEQRRRIFEGVESSDYFSVNDFFKYLESKLYKLHVRVFLSRYRGYVECEKCGGTRLKREALLFTVGGKNIVELCEIEINDLFNFFSKLTLEKHDEKVSEPVLAEIRKRVGLLKDIGIGYLTLNRLSRSLSGGECQRINLAASLGSSLTDTLYVLDEPSIGLHERDNQLLIGILGKFRDSGNTVAVIEHDKKMMEVGEHVIDLGPYGGERGGEIIYRGDYEGLLKDANSITALYLRGEEKIELPRPEGRKSKGSLNISGASEHNLKNIKVNIPLGCFSVVTGVSGSGKSTLLYDVLYNNYLRYKGKGVENCGAVKSIDGFDLVKDIVLIDQSPIGHTPRSNPVTYIKAFDEIRKIFARTKEAKLEGLTPGHFSFNVEGGRCDKCKGEGIIKVEMHFLADVYVECDKCNGKRYKDEVLGIHYRGKNIFDVLNMTVAEAMSFFSSHQRLVRKLSVLSEIGLGYIKLGQTANTLSRGESQRLKLAVELSGSSKRRKDSESPIVYIFDEPTIGLHYYDIKYLMEAFKRLLNHGNSVIAIEHNMEVIKCADHIVDLGPEGGDSGGYVLYQGALRDICGAKDSYTAKYLREYL